MDTTAQQQQQPSANGVYPPGWAFSADFDPKDHLMNLKGRDYMVVATRLLWFIRDQRTLIVAGLARVSYTVNTELVELDRETGWALFKTTARDVLGNESVGYGSETAKDFADYIEKASTKSQGRALLGLGYGTIFAPEIDEGERVVDTPVERADERVKPAASRPPTHAPTSAPATHRSTSAPTSRPPQRAKAPNPWLATDGYDPIGDSELRRRVKALGITNMADFETLLRDVRENYQHYTRTAIEAEVTVREGKRDAARAKVAPQAPQATQPTADSAPIPQPIPHDLRGAFTPARGA